MSVFDERKKYGYCDFCGVDEPPCKEDCKADELIGQLFKGLPASDAECKCVMLTSQTPWEPADWEQADDCLVHPLPVVDAGEVGV